MCYSLTCGSSSPLNGPIWLFSEVRGCQASQVFRERPGDNAEASGVRRQEGVGFREQVGPVLQHSSSIQNNSNSSTHDIPAVLSEAPRLSIQTFVPYPPLRLVPWGKGRANLVTGGFCRFHVLKHEYHVLPTPAIRQPHMPLPTVQENRIDDRHKERYLSIY